jgi:hypothetical protein
LKESGKRKQVYTIQVDITQKIKTPFKIKVDYKNSVADNSTDLSATFEFDDKNAKRKMIYGNPFEKDSTLVDNVLFKYQPEIPRPLVIIWVYVYEIDESTREDLYPFSSTK